MAAAKKPTTKKPTPKKVTKKPVVKKATPKKAAPKKSSILSYTRPKELKATPKAAGAVSPTDNIVAEPVMSTANPELDKPTLPPEQLVTGETGLISAPLEKEEPSSPLAAAQPSIEDSSSESPDVISGAPLPSSVPPPSEVAQASSITLPPSVTKIQRRRRLKRIFMVLVVVVLLAAAGIWLMVYRQPDVQTANQQLIGEVSQRVVVPTGETPSITTVVDETKVNQEFLRLAKKGDKVLLYFQSGRAIVYRPASHQVVNMGPLQAPKPRVFIRNGARQDNTAALSAKINESVEFLVASRDDAPKKDYIQTIVVDLAGNRPDVAGRLAKLIGATVGTLPDGESRPDADLLVITGSDYRP